MCVRVPTLLLLIMSYLTAADQHRNTHQDADDTTMFGEDISHGGMGRYRAYIGTRQTNADRHKRGVLSFLRAWIRVVRSTLGFRWVKYDDHSKGKTFVKVGTEEDALADFYSLGPTAVRREGNEITGLAGNHAVQLETPSADMPIPILYVANKRVKTIIYAENRLQAQLALRNLPVSTPQELSKPTLH